MRVSAGTSYGAGGSMRYTKRPASHVFQARCTVGKPANMMRSAAAGIPASVAGGWPQSQAGPSNSAVPALIGSSVAYCSGALTRLRTTDSASALLPAPTWRAARVAPKNSSSAGSGAVPASSSDTVIVSGCAAGSMAATVSVPLPTPRTTGVLAVSSPPVPESTSTSTTVSAAPV